MFRNTFSGTRKYFELKEKEARRDTSWNFDAMISKRSIDESNVKKKKKKNHD